MSERTGAAATPPSPADDPAQPSGGREAARQARLQREAEALRENLRRRKHQARARADQPATTPER